MIRNTQQEYGVVAKVLHTLSALLIAGSYLSVYIKGLFSPAARSLSMQAHFSIGITILVLTILRLFWKAANVSPPTLSNSPLVLFVSKIVHFLLYFALIMMPITGYFFTKSNTDFFGLFTIPSFKSLGLLNHIFEDHHLSVTVFQKLASFIAHIHKFTGEYILWVVILFHAGAAFYHHYALKDVTLARMIPWFKVSKSK